MKKLIAEYKMGGISFFIPCSDDFNKEAMPVEQNPEHQINEAIQDVDRLAEEIENGYDEAERFDDYMRNGEESLLRETENNFPL